MNTTLGAILDDYIGLPADEKVYIVSEYQTRFLQHRKLAGLSGENLDKARRHNREVINRFINTGELGVY